MMLRSFVLLASLLMCTAAGGALAAEVILLADFHADVAEHVVGRGDVDLVHGEGHFDSGWLMLERRSTLALAGLPTGTEARSVSCAPSDRELFTAVLTV